MPYIPQFNRISLQEQAYAPSLMRQQHDEAVTKQMELADALKFDYLKQDAPILEPVLNKYSEDIQKVSSDLAKQGFTQDTKSKLLGLRSKYTGDDKIRNIKNRYSEAMQGWEDRKKSLLQQRASGEDINAMRKAYFEGITPAYDEEGFKQDLTPGATSNVYDISEDIKNKFANIGSSEVVYGGSGVKAIREVLGKGTPYERSAWKILDSTGGTKANNLSQREAVKALTLSEYTDPSSDRALYARLTNKSPEYISGLVDQWSNAMAKDQIGQVAQTRGSYEFDKENTPGSSTPLGYLKQSGYGLVATDVNDLDKKVYEDVANKLARDEAKATGLAGVNTLSDLKKAADEVKAEKMAVTQIGGPSVINFPTANAVKAKNALKQIDEKLKNKAEGTALPTYEINTIARASGKSINEANDLQKGFDDYVSKHINRFTPVGGDKDDLEDLVNNVTVTDFSPNFKANQAGIVLYLHGEDSKGKPKDIPVTLDGTDTKTEETLVSYLNQMNPIIGLEYQYGKEDESGKEEFLSDLEKAIPFMTNPQAVASASSFVESKKLYRK